MSTESLSTMVSKPQTTTLLVLDEKRARIKQQAEAAIAEIQQSIRLYGEMLAREYGLPTGPDIHYDFQQQPDGLFLLTAVLPPPPEEKGEGDNAPVAEEPTD